MKKKYIFGIALTFILIAGILSGPIMSIVEQARYKPSSMPLSHGCRFLIDAKLLDPRNATTYWCYSS